jgi:hypothetical protein
MKVKKVYTTTQTLCKNGVTKPITRVHLETDCDVCHQPMLLEKHVKGGYHKRAWKRWRCIDKECNYSKVEESISELERGFADEYNDNQKNK